MAFRTIEDVLGWVELVADPGSPLDRGDLDALAVDLPHLRRPRGEDGAWDIARFRALPPALRSASCWFVVRAEVYNGGVEQLVWNQFSILPEMIEAFAHIGAYSAAALLNELGTELVESAPGQESNAVQAFLDFRRRLGDHGWSGDVDLVDDIGDSLVRHATRHPAEFVVASVEEQEWSDGRDRFRAVVLRRPDDRYEVQIDKWFETADGHRRWAELPRDAETAPTVEAARRIVRREQSNRSVSPTRLCFTVESCSRTADGHYALYPSFPIDRFPQEARLSVRLRFPNAEPTEGAESQTVADGTFRTDIGRRAEGIVTLDPDAAVPAPRGNPHLQPWWGSGWEVECTSIEGP